MTLMWKKISADKVRMTLVLDGHQGWLGLGVSNDGMALCTGSWDSFLKLWA